MAKKETAPETITVKLVRSLSNRPDAQVAVVHSLGLRKIGDVSVQPDNAATRGKIFKVSHLVETN
ncbi:MAG: 50S ribosomal protein L30 [Oscillospiraceae bacterium]|nr:50S ribosomal protein L30 [Oscillospiraceae bacterium]